MREDQLASVLSDFARTMLTDFRIQTILDSLVQRIVEILDVSGAGVTLIAPGLAAQYVAASDEQALRFEQLQTELDQGPCRTAYDSGEHVSVPDLAADGRYPAFGPSAVAAGLAAVFTFPLRHGDGRLGALDLYRDTTGSLDPGDVAAAQTLADVASAYLLNAQARQLALQTSNEFRESALHDALTGLPNRRLLQQRLQHAAERARRSHTTSAVLFADLDRFKRVNDTYGHTVGDTLLVEVGARLAALVRPGDTLARVSGDEFVVLCEDLASVGDVELLATRIDNAFVEPFRIAGRELLVTASVGIAYAGPGEAIGPQLLNDADTAMYQAKRRGGATHHVIDLRAAELSRDHDDLEVDLRASLADRGAGPGYQLDVAYQPIVRVGDGSVTGVEALLRWTHPVRGPVPAVTAVGMAEKSGLIVDLGAWVLERACRDRVLWTREHPDRLLELSVNISARQVLHPGFADTVARVLETTAMDPAALVLEVTEGIFIDDGERAMRVLTEVKALGVRLALDDFGTGYSSLSYLQRFPVDVVKIDQGFIVDVGASSPAASIVAAVTHLAHLLGMTVTAEGVETEQQRDAVADIGCEHAQGFFYSAALAAPQLQTQLRAAVGARGLHLPVQP